MIETVSTWLISYAIHSSLLLGGAALLSAFVLRRDTTRDLVWKAALVGGLISATAPAAIGYQPLLGVLQPAEEAAEPAGWMPEAELTAVSSKYPRGAGISGGPAVTQVGASFDVARALVWTWAIVALLLVAHLAVRHLYIRRVLRDRRDLPPGDLRDTLDAWRRRAGIRRAIRLSTHPACPTPIALSRSGICLPERLLTELRPVEQRAALAHELAHLVRNDPVWQLLGSVVQRVLFFQPLNALGLRKWRESAEYLCDAWAVQQTGGSLSLARSLARVASWVAEPSGMRVPEAVAMAGRASPLVARIERLTSGTSEQVGGRPFGLATVAIFVLATFAVAAPGVRLTPDVRPGDRVWAGRLDPDETIEVKAVTGHIRITASPTDEVIVRAFAEGRDADRVAYDAISHAGGVTVCSIYPPVAGKPENICEPGPWRMHSSDAKVRVDFEIQVPATAQVVARTMTGDIRIEPASSNVVARTTTGNVTIRVPDPGWSGRVDVANTTGDMTVWIPAEASLRVNARSESARVTSEFPTGQFLNGRHGEGTPTGVLTLASAWGEIALRKSD